MSKLMLYKLHSWKIIPTSPGTRKMSKLMFIVLVMFQAVPVTTYNINVRVTPSNITLKSRAPTPSFARTALGLNGTKSRLTIISRSVHIFLRLFFVRFLVPPRFLRWVRAKHYNGLSLFRRNGRRRTQRRKTWNPKPQRSWRGITANFTMRKAVVPSTIRRSRL